MSNSTAAPRLTMDLCNVDMNIPLKKISKANAKSRTKELIKNRNRPTSVPSSVILTPKQCNYFSSGMVHCCIVRSTSTPPSTLRVRYEFMYQSVDRAEEPPVMIAIKDGNNIRIFDNTRISAIDSKNSFKFNKKSGNYLGKMKADKPTFSLCNGTEEKTQIAAFIYDAQSTLKHWKDGQPPRKMSVAIPFARDDGSMEALAPYLKNRMVENVRRKTSTGIQVYTTKEPSFERGQYRLNFNGRVTLASVKNMQIVDSDGEMFAQFGKVGEHRFHLDYKHPFNALQAFALALSAIEY